MPRPTIIALRLAAGLACLAACLLGQVESARIIGNVTDQSGAVMPGVAVTITNVDTNLSYQTETNSAGRYESVPLRIGPYRVAAEQAGFRRVLRDGIILQIQETA
ncbi:MAG: carboxypeptidase regulatory-like domain-containing protein, partial [Acidobacteriia bacterium]|nr:carboxypeptidase regulatory-like domain-containing protein [Terriglobia bacterium]